MPIYFTDSNLWLRITSVPVYVGAIVLTSELLHRYTTASPEQVRKVVHIGTGNVILLAWLLQLPDWVGITFSSVSRDYHADLLSLAHLTRGE